MFTKPNINPFKCSVLKEKLLKVDWRLLNAIRDRNEAYKTFCYAFSNLYETEFPKIKAKVNSKTRVSPWITRGILNFSKQKQKLYK